MKQAVIYTRVSTQRQADEGVSLADQLERCRGHCQRMGYEVIGEYQDAGISGKTMNRPGLQGALKLACDNKAAFIAYSLDRFTRSTIDAITIAEQLRKAGAGMVSLTENLDTLSPTGEFIYTVFAALGQLERKRISQRTKAAAAYNKARGHTTGGTRPYGFDVGDDGMLIPIPRELRNIELMNDLRKDGYSYQAIANELKARGILTKQGRTTWQKSVIKKVLARAA